MGQSVPRVKLPSIMPVIDQFGGAVAVYLGLGTKEVGIFEVLRSRSAGLKVRKVHSAAQSHGANLLKFVLTTESRDEALQELGDGRKLAVQTRMCDRV